MTEQTPVLALIPEKLKYRILVLGINYAPNQFTRAVERYGCTPIHIKGYPNANFPRFPDAAIVCTSYTSHAAYWAVKAAFKDMNKPLWLVGNGFSECKEAFERWLMSRRGFVMPPEVTLAGQLVVPNTWLPDEKLKSKQTDEPKDEVMEVSAGRAGSAGLRYDEKTRLQIYQIVKQHYKQFKYDQVAEKLNAAGYKKTNGSQFTGTDVAGIVKTMKDKGEVPGGAPRASEPSTVAAPTKLPASAAPQFNVMDLIQKVTISQVLQPAEKIELIQRISLGEITQPESVERAIVDNHLVIESVSILRAKADNVQVLLTKTQAELVLSNLDALDKFMKGQSL